MRGRDIYIFVFDGMDDWNPVSALFAIDTPQREASRHRILKVGLKALPVTTIGGLRIVPDVSVSEIKPSRGAMLILPSGDLWANDDCAEILNVVREFRIRGLSVAAISAATLALARAGMLDDFHHTSNSRAFLAASGYRGPGFYCDVPAITDEGLITASHSARLEFAREIFRELGIYSQPLDAWHSLLRFSEASRYPGLLTCASR